MAEGKYSIHDTASDTLDDARDLSTTDECAPASEAPAAEAPAAEAPVVGAPKAEAGINHEPDDANAGELDGADDMRVNEGAEAKVPEKKRPIVLIVILSVLAVLLIAAGIYLAICGCPFKAAETSKEQGDPTATDKPGICAPLKTPGDKDKDPNGENPGDDPGNDHGNDPGNDPGNNPGNDPNGNSNGEDPNKKNNGQNGNTGNNGNPGQVWHPAWDEWVVSGHYETRYIDHPAVYGERTIYGARCNDCGYTTSIPSELYEHLDTMGHQGYSTGVPIGTEFYLIQAAWSEPYQVWVDTSHWVHHPGYWK